MTDFRRGPAVSRRLTTASGAFRLRSFENYICLPCASPEDAIRTIVCAQSPIKEIRSGDAQTALIEVLIDKDISPRAREAFQKLFKAAECSFMSPAGIDDCAEDAAGAELAYCEIPSYKELRIYPFGNIFEFLRYFGIKTIVGMARTDIFQCAELIGKEAPDFIVWHDAFAVSETGGSLLMVKASPDEASLIDDIRGTDSDFDNRQVCGSSFAESDAAVKIARALEKLPKELGVEVTYPGSDSHPDYKNRRKYFKFGGNAIFVRTKGDEGRAIVEKISREISGSAEIAECGGGVFIAARATTGAKKSK